MGLDLQSLSRRELQLLAKEFQLCRGNAKSDVILQHVVEFISTHAADGEQRVQAALGLPVEGAAAAKKTASDALEADATSSDASTQEESEELEETKPQPVAKPKASPAKASPAKASPAKTTPIQTTPVKTTPSKATTAKATPAKASPKPAELAATAAKPAASPAKASPTGKRKRSEPATTAPEGRLPAPTAVDKKVVATKDQENVKQKSASKSEGASAPPRRALASIENASPALSDAQPTPAEVVAFVEAKDDLEFTKDGRVRCSTTSHDMKADLTVIKEHLRGKRYARARGLKKFSLAKYAPMFSAHPDEKQAELLVWCNVTESAIARSREQIEAHMAGPRYQKQLPLWKEEQAAKAKAEAEAAAREEARKLAIKKRRLEREAAAASADKPTAKRAKGSS